MHLVHFAAEPNFGDALSPWLMSRLAPELLDQRSPHLLVAIGTLLNDELPAGPLKIVFGAGAGYGNAPLIDDTWVFYCVRGPLTADKLGLAPGLAVTDPGLLVRLFASRRGEQGRIGYMPHHSSVRVARLQGLDLERECREAGYIYLPPEGDVDAVLRELSACELVITEAMHGAIVADALDIAWIPVQTSPVFFSLKWDDWCASLGLRYRPVQLQVLGHDTERATVGAALAAVVGSTPPMLSSSSRREALTEVLQQRLEALRSDHARGRFPADDVPAAWAALPHSTPDTWPGHVAAMAEEVDRAVPPDALVILMDEQAWGCAGRLKGRRVHGFGERDGVYWGAPSDGAEAAAWMERLIVSDPAFLVVPSENRWMLDHYVELGALVRTRFRSVYHSDSVEVLELIATA